MSGHPRRVSVALTCLILLAIPVRAQDSHAEFTRHRAIAENTPLRSETDHVADPQRTSRKRPGKAAWIATWAAFVAVNILDAYSSGGRHEANPLLRDNNGLFNSRQAAIVKTAAGGGFFALQCWLIHSNPQENHYGSFAIATGATAAALGAVAVRNYNLYRAPDAQNRQAATTAPEYLLRKP